MSRGGRAAAVTLAAVIVPGIVVGIVGAAVLGVAQVHVPAGYLVGVAVVALGLLRLGRITLAELEPPPARSHGPRRNATERPAIFAPLERRLANATRQRRLYLAGLQPMLWDLARERVRLHNGVDLDRLRVTDPATARELLGADAWQWLTARGEDGPAPTPEQVTALVRTVARL